MSVNLMEKVLIFSQNIVFLTVHCEFVFYFSPTNDIPTPRALSDMPVLEKQALY